MIIEEMICSSKELWANGYNKNALTKNEYFGKWLLE
jgi:hypothetical protein